MGRLSLGKPRDRFWTDGKAHADGDSNRANAGNFDRDGLNLNANHPSDETRACHFKTSPGKGIPLGNLTSQLFANVYLNELDQFVKHSLRSKRYIRYCDDFIFIESDPSVLEGFLAGVRTFLTTNLLLSLHPHKVTVRTFRQGVDFLGYIVTPFGILPRTKTKNRAGLKITPDNRASYFGYLSHAKSERFQDELLNQLWLTTG